MPQEREIRLDWMGDGMRFDAHGTNPTTPGITLDGDGETGPSPMLALLMAAASCSGADVVSILDKMRAGLTRLRVDVRGVRRDEHPKRYTEIRFRFALAGESLDRAKAERAVSLSLEKYCSVVHSLDPGIRVHHEIEVA